MGLGLGLLGLELGTSISVWGLGFGYFVPVLEGHFVITRSVRPSVCPMAQLPRL